MSATLALAFAWSCGLIQHAGVPAVTTTPPAPVAPAPDSGHDTRPDEQPAAVATPSVEVLVPVELEREVTVTVLPGGAAETGAPPSTTPAPRPSDPPASTTAPLPTTAPPDPAPTVTGTAGPPPATATEQPADVPTGDQDDAATATATTYTTVTGTAAPESPAPTSTAAPTQASPSTASTGSGSPRTAEATSTADPTTTAEPTTAPTTPSEGQTTSVGEASAAPTTEVVTPTPAPTTATSTEPAGPAPTMPERTPSRPGPSSPETAVPRISGPRVERRPPQDQAGQEPVGFTARASSAVPQWAAGVRVEAQDVAASDTGLVSGRDVVEVSLPGSRWDELGEGNAAFGLLADSGKDVVWSVPLDVQNTPLEEIAGGSYDQRWATLGRLVARPDSQVVVRPVVPADADPAQAKAAFRRAAAALQSAGVLVEWSAAPGFDMTRLPEAWPGPDVVDVVGVEIGVEAFPRQVGGPGGLADWRTWATSHRKRLAVHWDLENADPLYVQQMASWLDVAARSSVLAYDTVDATDGVDARSLRIYRGLWPQ